MANPSPFSKVDGGLHLRLRLTPKASANRLSGTQINEKGEAVLKAQVTTVPEGGKANTALIKMLAKEWKLPKSSIEVVQGATDRNKTLFISGDPRALYSKLNR